MPSLKWGVQSNDPIAPSTVLNYAYNENTFLDSVPGSQELRAYFGGDFRGLKKVDTTMIEGGNFYDDVTKPDLLQSDKASLGGPAYLEVGLDE